MDQAGLSSPFCQDLFDVVVLTEGLDLSDELDLNIILGGDCFCMGADLLSQGIGKLRVVENPDLVQFRKAVMPRSKHHPGRIPCPVIVGDNSSYLFTVTLCK